MVLGRVQEHRAAQIDAEAAAPFEATPVDVDLVDANLGDVDIRIAGEGRAITEERI
jgi:hypothetical protein